MSKITTIDHLKATAQRASGLIGQVAETTAEALEEMGASKADKANFVSASIPTTAWVANSKKTLTAEGYAYMADVAMSGVTVADKAEVIVPEASRTQAKSCGIADISDTLAGAVRLYAVSKPSAAITVQINVEKGGN